MRTLKERGVRIPDDIAVAGFNNDAISQVVEPALTTVNYPGKEMGMVAAETLLQQMRDACDITPIDSIILSSDLIVRGSSLRK